MGYYQSELIIDLHNTHSFGCYFFDHLTCKYNKLLNDFEITDYFGNTNFNITSINLLSKTGTIESTNGVVKNVKLKTNIKESTILINDWNLIIEDIYQEDSLEIY